MWEGPSRGATAAGAAGVLGLLANEEAVLGLSEARPTRLAWLCVAGQPDGTSRGATLLYKWLSAIAFTITASYHAYALFNAAARRKPINEEGYALLEEKEESPEDAAGPASTGVFAWMSPLLAKGYARPLEARDLFPLIREDDPDAVASRLRHSLQSKPKLVKALIAAFGPHFCGWLYKLATIARCWCLYYLTGS